MRIDCHTHTRLCGHAQGEVDDYVRSAEQRGIDVLAITEHLPLPQDLDPDGEYSMALCDLEPYVAAVKAADVASPLTVLLGVEADWLPGRMEPAAVILQAHPFDIVLGSVHFVDDWAFDDPALVGRYATTDVDALWRRYFDLLCDAASSGMFDVMSHPDLVKKFGFTPSFDPSALYASAAAALAEAGVAIEVSTGGLRKPCKELYPSLEFLAACRREGVRCTVGSDAHRPSEVGADFDLAREALLETGYTSVVYYQKRVAQEVPL